MTAEGPDAGRIPWWASGSDGPDARDEDPLTAHRDARRGRHGGQASDPGQSGPSHAAPDGWWDAASEQLVRIVRDASDAAHEQAVANARRAARGEPRGDDPAPSADHQPDDVTACQICPLCTGIRLLGEHRPELLGHVAEAARHLSLAARTLLDGHADRAGPPGRDDDLEHIDLE